MTGPLNLRHVKRLNGPLSWWKGRFSRDELWQFWDYSLFLDVPPDIAAQRMADRDALNGSHSAESLPRYIGAQQIYFRQVRPWERASLVVDNTDFNEPRVIEAAQADAAR